MGRDGAMLHKGWRENKARLKGTCFLYWNKQEPGDQLTEGHGGGGGVMNGRGLRRRQHEGVSSIYLLNATLALASLSRSERVHERITSIQAVAERRRVRRGDAPLPGVTSGCRVVW